MVGEIDGEIVCEEDCDAAGKAVTDDVAAGDTACEADCEADGKAVTDDVAEEATRTCGDAVVEEVGWIERTVAP